ncbi:hypothetical protein FFZ77_07445 [Streptomyces katsurahamanus]|uniref:Uncharacterized protein n=2 Tax=Streptomyces katsurahamanus TaxID=2577098 RepID=A0ABW9NQ68_9ACTN|nr:hypothetical protein [Streptomyces katsurahamanus]
MRHSADCMSDAEDAVTELIEALKQNGLVFPSVRVEVASYARESPCPLIELGRTAVDTVRRLSALLRRDEGGAAR